VIPAHLICMITVIQQMSSPASPHAGPMRPTDIAEMRIAVAARDQIERAVSDSSSFVARMFKRPVDFGLIRTEDEQSNPLEQEPVDVTSTETVDDIETQSDT
jgi:hypothetical protein